MFASINVLRNRGKTGVLLAGVGSFWKANIWGVTGVKGGLSVQFQKSMLDREKSHLAGATFWTQGV